MQQLNINGNSYNVTNRKNFVGTVVNNESLKQIIDFSYDMSFGAGHHRQHRSGGTNMRKAGEQFCNVFQGKLAEVVVREYLMSKRLDVNEPDFNVYGIGVWDDSDLYVNGKNISVKSAAHFSNLLLLETKDYDDYGNYIPNLKTGKISKYDYYVLVRINPDIKTIFRKNKLLYNEYIDRQTIEKLIFSQEWKFEITGFVSHDDFVSVINNRHIIPQNAMLNGNTKMDADNYYIQASDMRNIIELPYHLYSCIFTLWRN